MLKKLFTKILMLDKCPVTQHWHEWNYTSSVGRSLNERTCQNCKHQETFIGDIGGAFWVNKPKTGC